MNNIATDFINKLHEFINKLHEFINNLYEKPYENYVKLKRDIAEPFIEILLYLQVPAFTALLSLILFAFVDQTLEVYRIFALNPLKLIPAIVSSFASIFLLSLSIWYSSKALLIGRVCGRRKPFGRDSATKWSRKWLPRIFGYLPLLALGFGLLRAMIIPGVWNWQIPIWLQLVIFAVAFILFTLPSSLLYFYLPFLLFVIALGVALSPNLPKSNDDSILIFNFTSSFKCEQLYLFYLFLGILIAVLLSKIYLIFVAERRRKKRHDGEALRSGRRPQNIQEKLLDLLENLKNLPENLKNLPTDANLFYDPRFLVVLSFLSCLVFSIFSFPLITENPVIRFFVIILIALSWYLFVQWLAQLELFTIKVKVEVENNFLVTLLFCLVLILTLGAIVPPVSNQIGAVSIVALFLIVFIFWGSKIFFYGYLYEIPIITILLILVVVASSFDLNDNHRLRELHTASYKDLPGLENGFETWIKDEDRTKEIGKFSADHKYPIYIVSAQGGGIYAAYHAALVLSRLHDLNNVFSKHVFAISGVSGGSLGAALFAGLVKLHDNVEKITLKEKITPEVEVLGHDFLSPLLAAGLFPDFIQRFIPFPFNFADRARGLEYAFEQAWDKVNGKDENPLRNSFYELWDPTGNTPALVLNTTVVETGERLVLSPFKLDLPTLKDIRTVACDPKIDFPLSTAAVLSARFPLVTPVAWFKRRLNNDGQVGMDKCKGGGQKARLADGGYFENSGVSTAIDIGSILEEKLEELKMDKVKVIYLAIISSPSRKLPKAGGLNELTSPIRALYNSREARSNLTVAQAEDLLDDFKANPGLKDGLTPSFQNKYAKHRFRQIFLYDQKPVSSEPANDDKLFPLPLGWFLSQASQDFIRKQLGDEGDCADDLNETTNNTCVFKSIKEDLSLEQSLGT
jgi:predicted acylesterase/phospholipase RssA